MKTIIWFGFKSSTHQQNYPQNYSATKFVDSSQCMVYVSGARLGHQGPVPRRPPLGVSQDDLALLRNRARGQAALPHLVQADQALLLGHRRDPGGAQSHVFRGLVAFPARRFVRGLLVVHNVRVVT